MSDLNFSDLEIDFDDIEGVDTSGDEHTYIEKCLKCGGTGQWVGGYVNHTVRKCFACNGVGHKEYKTSPEARKAAKQARNKASRDRIEANAERGVAYLEANPVLKAWITDTVSWNKFAASLLDSISKYGSLTEGQLKAALKSAEKHAAKQVEKASQAKEQAENAPVIESEGLKPILEAFDKAKESGLKRPKIRLDGFQLSLAPATGRNAGHLYVKNGSEYLGKISPEGKFLKPHNLSVELAADIDAKLIATGKNPMEAAVAYGKRTGECSCCGRELTREDSIERGMGAICAGRYGF